MPLLKFYDGPKYLTVFVSEKYDAIFNLISTKNSITDVFSHYYAKIKVDSFDYLSIGKILTLNNVIGHVKRVLTKDKKSILLKINI